MRSEREAFATHALQGAVVAAKTIAALCERSYSLMSRAHGASSAAARHVSTVATRGLDSAAVLSQRALPLVRKGARRVHGVALVASSRSVATARSMSTRGRRAWIAGARAFTRPFAETALEHQEFNGSVVAVLLAVTVVGYGGFLATLWWTPDARVTPAIASFEPAAAEAPAVMASPVMASTVAMRRADVVEAAAPARPRVVPAAAVTVAPRASFTPNTRTLTALWQRRDTRSLDRAFSTLRGETLAFRRCAMRVTDVDRAVARCDGIVIDFQRTAGRWRIARVTTR
jgi:hypothetical protein